MVLSGYYKRNRQAVLDAKRGLSPSAKVLFDYLLDLADFRNGELGYVKIFLGDLARHTELNYKTQYRALQELVKKGLCKFYPSVNQYRTSVIEIVGYVNFTQPMSKANRKQIESNEKANRKQTLEKAQVKEKSFPNKDKERLIKINKDSSKEESINPPKGGLLRGEREEDLPEDEWLRLKRELEKTKTAAKV